MDLNDSSLFTPTITPANDPFDFVEESAVNNPGVVAMSGYEVSSVTKTTCGDS
jgi:hypothetical protein